MKSSCSVLAELKGSSDIADTLWNFSTETKPCKSYFRDVWLWPLLACYALCTVSKRHKLYRITISLYHYIFTVFTPIVQSKPLNWWGWKKWRF